MWMKKEAVFVGRVLLLLLFIFVFLLRKSFIRNFAHKTLPKYERIWDPET